MTPSRDHVKPARLIACVLLGAAILAPLAASAYVPPKVHVQAHTLTHESMRQYQLGNRTAALSSLSATHRLMMANQQSFSAVERQRVKSLIDQINLPNERRVGADSLTKYRSTLLSLDPLQHAAKLTPPPEKRLGQTQRLLQSAWASVPHAVVVRTDVLRFGNEFRTGAKSPNDTLAREKYRLHAKLTVNSPTFTDMYFSQANWATIDAWLSTPQERRVFVIGARDDAAYVQALRARYSTEDAKFFFYQDCKPLCHESTVGAFFGSAGTVVHVESPDAKNSSFVLVEKGLTLEHSGGGRKLLLIDGDVARRLLNVGGAGSGAATVLVCGIEALVSNDALCK